MISAKIICDSVNPANVRLTTFVLTYPRFIHAEFMTHRAISRNAASSRAIPIEKMMRAVDQEPAMPEFWAENQKGMQATGELEDKFKTAAILEWGEARWSALGFAKRLSELGLHKAIVNRVLEPFSHITVVATADRFGWTNLFALRAHPMAQQEFQVLAYRMLDAYLRTAPRKLEYGEWHLPFITREDQSWEQSDFPNEDYETLPVKVSTARCARVSYLNHDGVRSIEDDLKLYERLVTAKPPHASAFEHAAQACSLHPLTQPASNFDPSWRQHRKSVAGESTRKLDLKAVLANKPDWITL